MVRYMYDADNPYDIPRNAQMVAGYVDGSATTWRPEWWSSFGQAKLVTISAVGRRWDADVFDVEPGCIWPPENVLPLIERARANGRNPTVYCNQLQHWPGIRRMFQSRGLAEPPYWVANYDKNPTIPAGAVAKQYMHPPQTGKHYDYSAVLDFWPGVDGEGEDMPTADEVANAVIGKLLSPDLYLLDERPGVPDGERHHSTFKNALWSSWHTMHYGDPINGLYPSNRAILDAVEAVGIDATPEQMEAFAERMETVISSVIAKGVEIGMGRMHAVFAARPVEGTAVSE